MALVVVEREDPTAVQVMRLTAWLIVRCTVAGPRHLEVDDTRRAQSADVRRPTEHVNQRTDGSEQNRRR